MDAQSPLTGPSFTVAAAIIAGGKASRLGGVTKGLLQVAGRSIVETQVRLLRPLFSRVLVVTNDPKSYRHLAVPLIPDRMGAGLGPLAGVQAALSGLLPSECAVVCIAVDMPFLCTDILCLVRDYLPSADAVAPFVGGFLEPLCARYHRRVLAMITALVQRGQLKCSEALTAVGVTRLPDEAWQAIDPLGRFATNINTPQELNAVVAPHRGL